MSTFQWNIWTRDKIYIPDKVLLLNKFNSVRYNIVLLKVRAGPVQNGSETI